MTVEIYGRPKEHGMGGNSKSAHQDPETYSSFGDTSKLMILGVKAGVMRGRKLICKGRQKSHHGGPHRFTQRNLYGT